MPHVCVIVLKHRCGLSTQTGTRGDVNSWAAVVTAGIAPLLQDRSDACVLWRWILDAVWQDIVGTSGQKILMSRLSKGRDWYWPSAYSPMNMFIRQMT